jgi:hypothetical protein
VATIPPEGACGREEDKDRDLGITGRVMFFRLLVRRAARS